MIDAAEAATIAPASGPTEQIKKFDAGAIINFDGFKKVVDAATAALYTGGEGQKIYDKWFTQKIPPKGLNLATPISAELKNEFAKPSDSPDPDSYK